MRVTRYAWKIATAASNIEANGSSNLSTEMTPITLPLLEEIVVGEDLSPLVVQTEGQKKESIKKLVGEAFFKKMLS